MSIEHNLESTADFASVEVPINKVLIWLEPINTEDGRVTFKFKDAQGRVGKIGPIDLSELTDTNGIIGDKATKAELAAGLEQKAYATLVDAQLADKVDSTLFEFITDRKADKDTVDTVMSLKANKYDVKTLMASKLSVVEFVQLLNNYVTLDAHALALNEKLNVDVIPSGLLDSSLLFTKAEAAELIRRSLTTIVVDNIINRDLLSDKRGFVYVKDATRDNNVEAGMPAVYFYDEPNATWQMITEQWLSTLGFLKGVPEFTMPESPEIISVETIAHLEALTPITTTIAIVENDGDPIEYFWDSGVSQWSQSKYNKSHNHQLSEIVGLVAALSNKASLVNGKVPAAQLQISSDTEFLSSYYRNRV